MHIYKIKIFREVEFQIELEAVSVDVAVDLARMEANKDFFVTSERIEAEVTLR